MFQFSGFIAVGKNEIWVCYQLGGLPLYVWYYGQDPKNHETSPASPKGTLDFSFKSIAALPSLQDVKLFLTLEKISKAVDDMPQMRLMVQENEPQRQRFTGDTQVPALSLSRPLDPTLSFHLPSLSPANFAFYTTSKIKLRLGFAKSRGRGPPRNIFWFLLRIHCSVHMLITCTEINVPQNILIATYTSVIL